MRAHEADEAVAPLRVLLVEDNAADADLVQLALAEAGARVELYHAERLDRALVELGCTKTDAVLLDLNLPDASGTEGVKALHDSFPTIPLVVLTGAFEGAGLDALAAGAQDFLRKGQLDGAVIERALRYAVERQRHQERAQELAAERASREVAESAARLLELSYRVAEAALTHADLKACMGLIVGEVRAGFAADSATLLLPSEDGQELVVEACEGLDGYEGERVPLGRGVAGAIAAGGRALAVPDVSREEISGSPPQVLASVMGTPLELAGRTIGVLHVGSFRPRAFTADELRMLDALGSRVALVIENAQLRERERRTEQALREADRRKDEFLAVLSHELRSPLAPIRNSIHILERAPSGREQARRALAVIERQVSHMTRLVSDLLDVNRITSGKIQLRRDRVDLRAVVSRSLEDLGSIFEVRGLELSVTLPDGPVWVQGDATRLAQSITNLLNNAVKFTPEGGRVTVELWREHATACVRVRDTGVGIAPDMLARLFVPFAQADRTLDRSGGGLGLGLALVKGLVELHGGRVEAHSAGTGQGAEVTLRLPAHPDVAAAVQHGPSQPAEPAPGIRARRVLIIEDSLDAALSLKEALELDRHEVAVAFAGPEGIEKARELEPEVVLCDIGLPGMDGYEVARALRRDPVLSSIYLVAVTGYAQPEDQRRAREAGFNLHLAKPLDLGVIQRMLAECR